MYLLYTFGSVFLMSLLGSLHCASMCGGFAAFCASHSGSPLRVSVGYHIGRLAIYGGLGALAGLLGETVDKTGEMLGVHWVSGFLVGVALGISGLSMLLPQSWLAAAMRQCVKLMPRLDGARSKLVQISQSSPARSGLLLGISASLLPCGWLYSFVLMAAGSSSMLSGAFIMAAFWLGTVPILFAGSFFAQKGFSLFGRYARVIGGAVVLSTGAFSLYQHFAHTANVMSSCH